MYSFFFGVNGKHLCILDMLNSFSMCHVPKMLFICLTKVVYFHFSEHNNFQFYSEYFPFLRMMINALSYPIWPIQERKTHLKFIIILPPGFHKFSIPHVPLFSPS